MTDEDRPEFELEYYEIDRGGESPVWHWKVTSTGNHEIIIDTLGEEGGFASERNAERNFTLVQKALLSL